MARLIHLLFLMPTIGFGTVCLVACDTDDKSAKRDRDDDDDDRSDQEGDESSVSAWDKADIESCMLQILRIEQNLNLHRAVNKTFPTTSEGLEAARKSFTDGVIPKDSWGNEFQYTSDGSEFEIISLGKDGKRGGSGAAADISSNDLKR